MDRRRFLVGLGAFAGAALVVPPAPTIFDMGRDLIVPPKGLIEAMAYLEWLHHEILARQKLPAWIGFDPASSEGDYTVTMTLAQYRAFTRVTDPDRVPVPRGVGDPLTESGMVKVRQSDLLKHVLGV